MFHVLLVFNDFSYTRYEFDTHSDAEHYCKTVWMQRKGITKLHTMVLKRGNQVWQRWTF